MARVADHMADNQPLFFNKEDTDQSKSSPNLTSFKNHRLTPLMVPGHFVRQWNFLCFSSLLVESVHRVCWPCSQDGTGGSGPQLSTVTCDEVGKSNSQMQCLGSLVSTHLSQAVQSQPYLH